MRPPYCSFQFQARSKKPSRPRSSLVEALFPHGLHDLDLGGDAGVVRAGQPEGRIALHPLLADDGVLQRHVAKRGPCEAGPSHWAGASQWNKGACLCPLGRQSSRRPSRIGKWSPLLLWGRRLLPVLLPYDHSPSCSSVARGTNIPKRPRPAMLRDGAKITPRYHPYSRHTSAHSGGKIRLAP